MNKTRTSKQYANYTLFLVTHSLSPCLCAVKVGLVQIYDVSPESLYQCWLWLDILSSLNGIITTVNEPVSWGGLGKKWLTVSIGAASVKHTDELRRVQRKEMAEAYSCVSHVVAVFSFFSRSGLSWQWSLFNAVQKKSSRLPLLKRALISSLFPKEKKKKHNQRARPRQHRLSRADKTTKQ